jgi:hypothetical protein
MPIVEGALVKLPLAADATCATIISTCTNQSSIIKKCPAYTTTPAVEAVVIDMDASVAVLQGTEAQYVQTKALLATLDGQRQSEAVTVRLKHGAVESALNTAANNDPVAAKAWVGETKSRAKPVPVTTSTLAPENPALRTIKSRPGTVEASCAEEQGAVGYVFQTGSDPNHPDAWAPGSTTRGHTFKMSNLPIGQIVYVRIAVIRRGSIQSQWTPIIQIQVR